MEPKWTQAGFVSCRFADEGSEDDGDVRGAGGSATGSAEPVGSHGNATRESSGETARDAVVPENVPWSRDPRFREDYAALKEFKKEREAYNKWKQEREQYEKIRQEYSAMVAGEHPLLQERDARVYTDGFRVANDEWIAYLKHADLWEAAQRGLEEWNASRGAGGDSVRNASSAKKSEAATVSEDAEVANPDARPMTWSEWRTEMRVQRIRDTLDGLIASSPLNKVPDFAEDVTRRVFLLMKAEAERGPQTDEDLDRLARRTPEFYKRAEEFYRQIRDGLAAADAERMKAKPSSSPTLMGGRIPEGVSRREWNKRRMEALVAQLEREENAAANKE